MAGTASKSRSSGIPTPGRVTPARLRSSSSAASTFPTSFSSDSEAIDRAFAEAVKANDPSRHSKPQIPPTQLTAAFRRPSSAAASRPKTPTVSRGGYRRSESRQSDVFVRHSRSFEVGDNVRIESLGFEGTLRFIGEIDGKEGLFAGIELSGGFVGKGKNDGSVAGKYYFNCPPKCGVFVVFDKLSPPTVGHGAISRPTSAASSRASMPGRVTPAMSAGQLSAPSFSGRATPRSSTSGRVTPSFGFATPAARPKSVARSRVSTASAATTPSASAMSKITAGSRASKYIGVTASQLSARGGALTSPSRTNALNSPARVVSASPSRSTSSMSPSNSSSLITPKPPSRAIGLGTPKRFGQGRPSLATPKARLPSAVVMPPPPSPPSGGSNRSASLHEKPITPTFSSASNDTAVDDDSLTSISTIQQNSRALQDKIASLMNGKRTPSYGSTSPPNGNSELRADIDSKQSLIHALQERLSSMEQDNSRLRSELDSTREAVEKGKLLDSVRQERDEAVSQRTELESQLKMAERNVKERTTKIESLERSLQASSDALSSQRVDSDARLKELQDKLDDTVKLTGSLKDAIEAKSNEAGQNEGIIKAKNAEIELLDTRVKKAYLELEDARRDLGAQVDELRTAGQETIALYEERLSAAETKRYELEDMIESLEEQVKKQDAPVSPSAMLDRMSEAAKIDHETMREQIVHLQKKIAMLEDALEDARMISEREEAAVRARIQRFKEAEAAMKKEVADARREIENARKAEVTAKDRVAELEEALREEGLALENARAEVESLRAEVADLEGQRAGLAATDRGNADESFRREKTRQNEEITQLKEHLESARVARKEAAEALDRTRSELIEAQHSTTILSQRIEALDSDKAELERVHADLTAKFERERLVANELRASLDQKASEMEATARKSMNRDRPLNGGAFQDIVPAPTTPQRDEKSAREEIKGLKHIIQELQKEIASLSSQNKLLESENKFLLSETNQLREDLKSLEDNIEQSLLYEEQALAGGSGDAVTVNGLPDAQPTVKNDIEIEQFRKKMAEAEMKSARTIHDLNKEVSELESLVEAKIYREDELEREIERLKQKLARDKKSKSSTEPGLPDQRQRKSSTTSSRTNGGSVSDAATLSQEACEICEQPGHDIFSCPLLKDSSSPTDTRPRASDNQDLYCEECEGHGHAAVDCPYSNDVF